MTKTNKAYERFLEMPLRVKANFELQITSTCLGFFNSGDSITLSIVKTARALNKGRGFINRVVQNNPDMRDLFKAHRDAQLRKPWWGSL